jgi:hypothetical protein
VFPSTLSIALVSIWDNILADHPGRPSWQTILADHPVNLADPNAIQADEAGFNAWIAFFIEANATDDHRHELLDFIRHAKKPCY